MFGYVIINKGDMTFREFDVYRSYYCGLCRTLKEEFGVRGQVSLNYDMTFLVMLLSSLYEPETIKEKKSCIAHPCKKQKISVNDITRFAAEMNLLLTGYKCEDDWKDEKNIAKKMYGMSLKKEILQLREKYSEKAEIIEVSFRNMEKLEKENCQNIDRMASLFGKVTEELFIYRQDEWEEILRKMAFHLGKFIYMLDAYEDLEEDLKKNRYNPFSSRCQGEEFEKECKIIMTAAIAECTRAFEILPLIENVSILRNILYSGVWYRYEKIRDKKKKQKVENTDGSV